jgi:DNA recombination protein RmuC
MEIILIIVAAALLSVIALSASLTAGLRKKAGELEDSRLEQARLETVLDNEKAAAGEKIALLQDAEVRLKREFENLAHRIFEDRGRVLTEQNRERLSDLLLPFREQLASFRIRVDEVHRDDTDRSARLIEQVRQLTELSGRVSEEANNLARAIKGDAKAQGDWGELIVERIFEASGLEKGREYDSQPVLRDDDGSLKRPDFVVYLPGERAVIVDSKVSLTAFERYWSAEDPEERKAHLADHLKSVWAHIKELRKKDYTSLLDNRTLDFVVMCVPLEPAYGAAVGADQDLFYDLARTEVVVTGPANLMITLKLISQIWRRENENRNAAEIAERAGRLYDQVARIAEVMAEAKRRLAGVSESFDLALRRLREGRGNLVGRVEELRRLGAKVRKEIPAELAPAEDLTEEEEEPSGETRELNS